MTAVQFREKTAAPSLCSKAYAHLSRICTDYGAPLLLNADLLGRCDLETPPEAVHFNERTLPPHPHEAAVIAGYSAHVVEEAEHAFAHGVDFCTFSPIFETPSKSDFLPAIGVEQMRSARAAIPAGSLIALGGIDSSNAAQCVEAGADGVAVMRAIMSAADPEAAARELRRRVDAALDRRQIK